MTAVKSPQQPEVSIEEQEKQVEDYLVSLCHNLKQQPDSAPSSPTGSEDREDIKVFESITADSTRVPFSCKTERLFQHILNEDGLMDSFTQSPFFSQIINNPKLVREIILTHPLIVKLIELNPGLQEFIEQDENISTVIGILQKKDQPSMLKRSASIRRLIEAKMGHKLVYGKEHVGLAQSVHRSWTSSRSESS